MPGEDEKIAEREFYAAMGLKWHEVEICLHLTGQAERAARHAEAERRAQESLDALLATNPPVISNEEGRELLRREHKRLQDSKSLNEY